MRGLGTRPKARPMEKPQLGPMPEVCRVEFSSGCWFLIGHPEERKQQFDGNAWVITFLADYGDGCNRWRCWKVYPEKKTRQSAIEALQRRARQDGMVRIGILLVDEPEGMKS